MRAWGEGEMKEEEKGVSHVLLSCLLLRAVGILSRHESTVSWPHPGSRTCRPRGPRGGWGGRLSQGQTEGVPTKPAH